MIRSDVVRAMNQTTDGGMIGYLAYTKITHMQNINNTKI